MISGICCFNIVPYVVCLLKYRIKLHKLLCGEGKALQRSSLSLVDSIVDKFVRSCLKQAEGEASYKQKH